MTVEPEITTFKITPNAEYLILATDGVWDKVCLAPSDLYDMFVF